MIPLEEQPFQVRRYHVVGCRYNIAIVEQLPFVCTSMAKRIKRAWKM